MNLYARFGEMRVRPAPISESAFLGAAVGAAMAGLRPVVEIMLVDFIAVAADALVNDAAKLEAFSGGRWQAPMVVRATCGGGYGDGGQHEQALWAWLAHIPGLKVVVPSTSGRRRRACCWRAIEDDGPVVYLEHKLLSADWLDYLGSGGRTNVDLRHSRVRSPRAGPGQLGPGAAGGRQGLPRRGRSHHGWSRCRRPPRSRGRGPPVVRARCRGRSDRPADRPAPRPGHGVRGGAEVGPAAGG